MATIFDRVAGQGRSEKQYGDADHTILAGTLKHLYAVRGMVSWATVVATIRDIVAIAYESEGSRLPAQRTRDIAARLARMASHLGFSIVKDSAGFSQDNTLMWVLFASVFFIVVQIFRLFN